MATVQQASPPQWSSRLVDDLGENDAAAKGLVAGLTEQQLNWQPAPDSWSIGQCLEHLCITNEAYLPAVAAAIKNKPDSPVKEIAPGWFARWFLRSFIEISPKSKKARAPSKIRPGSSVSLSVLDRFLSGNQSCRELILQARNHDVNRIRFWNPFIPGVRFTVGTVLELIAGHERRHLLQAKRARESANFPR